MRNLLMMVLLGSVGVCIPAAAAAPVTTPHSATVRARRSRHPIMRMQATAFTPASNATAAGTVPHEGIVAADPAVLPLGSRIRVTGANSYSGIYTVTDTGNKVRGRHIDVCLLSAAEAKQFGKKVVRVQVLSRGAGKQDAREKDIPAAK
jgi:rare lipoprotein A